MDAVLLGVLTSVAVGLQRVFPRHYAAERRVIQSAARAERTHDLLAFWGTLNFAETSNPTLPDKFVASVDWPSVRLSPNQERAARERLRQVLAYLARPNFEEYLCLKSTGLQYQFRLSPRAGLLLGRTNEIGATSAPAQTARAIWDANISRSRPAEASRISAISLEEVAVQKTSTNAVSALIGGKLFKAITVAYVAPEPGFEYTALGDGAALRNPVCLNLSFYARSSSSTNPGPVHLSLRWSDSDDNWILYRMVSDVQLRLNTMF